MAMVQDGVKPPAAKTAAAKTTDWQFGPPEKPRWRTVLRIAAITAAVVGIALQFIGHYASSKLSPCGSSWMTLELTDRAEDLLGFLSKWDKDTLIFGLRLNSIFITAYGFTFVLLLNAAKNAKPAILGTFAKGLMVVALIGVVCDVTENCLMLLWVSGLNCTDGFVEFGRVISILKFFIIVPVFVFIALFYTTCKTAFGHVATTLKVIWAVRFPFFISVALTGLLFLQQGAEIIRVSVHGETPLVEVATAAARAAGQKPQLPPYPFNWWFIGDLVAVVAVAIAAWYFARMLLNHAPDLNADYNDPTENNDRARNYETWLMRHLPRGIASVLLCLGVAAATWHARTTTNFRQINDLLRDICIALIAIAVALYLGFIHRRREIDRRAKEFGPKPKADPAHPFTPLHSERVPLLLSTGIWFALLIIFIFWPVPVGRKLTPLVVILLGIGSWIPIGSFLAYLGTRKHVPFLTVLVLAACAFTFLDINDNHALRRLGNHNDVTNSVSEYFAKWSSTRPASPDHRYPVFLVATEGGGVRAAADTAIVLGGLQDSNALFFEHVFAISGVSGGSVGATVFSALCKSWHTNGATRDYPDQKSYSSLATNLFTQDYLSPLLGMGLFPDLLQRFIFPGIPGFDRVRGLETAFERSVTKDSESLLTKSYFKWHEAITDGPALLLNSTDVKSGRRMTVAPFHFGHENDDRPLLLADVANNFDLSLSTAMCISARFPIFTPAGYTIHSADNEQTKYRFVDGGFYENSGTATVLDVL
ncbi:MAG: patatin-like phospholipase family protein, partial [Limisphaerales bacterium]